MNQINKEAIDIHLRTYRSALQSSNEIAVSTLIPTYFKMGSLLHPKANSNQIDLQALPYVLNRFPKEILKTKLVVIGQTKKVFLETGYNLREWKEVKAPHRRRRTFFDPKTKTLACFAESISDVDDIVNLTIALQIELDKTTKQKIYELKKTKLPKSATNLKIKLLSGTWVNFSKNAQNWWTTVVRKAKPEFDLTKQPIIFVSSNNHSLINLLDNFCLDNKKEINSVIEKQYPQVKKQISQSKLAKTSYCTYFASQFVFKSDSKLWKKKLDREKKLGIVRIPPQADSILETQIIPGQLISKKLKGVAILNIEYPLGFAAYHTLEELFENVKEVLGVYILGKAAALNTKMGDILIPKVVFDEHTQNTYIIKNCFNKNFPYQFKSGSILDNQKLVSVLGVFLENKDLFNSYSKKEFNIIEMEAGPYLGAITQATYPKSLPQKTIVDLTQPPLDLGLIYYSSDNPYILSQTLGELMGISGIEATYLGTKAIIDKIKLLKPS